MPKQVNGVWLPDREEHLVADIQASPYFAGAGTVQLKKYAAAFPFIRQFRHAVDIGANCGIWTRVLARCFPLVTAFEPSAEAIECFWLNNPWREMNESSRVILKACALGAEAGTLRLNTQLRSSGFTRADPEGNTEVEMRTLDSFNLPVVDFIKIDVEGFEHPVVKGAVETIGKYRPVVIIEQKPDNAERQGFKRFGALNLLKKMGANVVAEISGDFVVQFPK
jgi:FkbM family methyltransferase